MGMSRPAPVLVIGGGIAGLNCARRLHEAGVLCEVLEASDAVGGRVRSDRVEGFVLDRGFQVLQTAYPEARAVLDYDALDLKAYEPGALINLDDRLACMMDPWRRPASALQALVGGVGTMADKLRLARLRADVCRGSLEALWQEPEQTTLAELQSRGFSEELIEQFLRPWMAGVFLEPELATSSRFFKFVFRMFSLGDAALPAAGMQAIPEQLASHLPPGLIKLHTTVQAVAPGGNQAAVVLANGTTRPASAVVLATDGATAAKLLPQNLGFTPPAFHCTDTVYFATDHPPLDRGVLVINGTRRGLINNLSVPSLVQPTYAPDGKHLISVSVLQSDEAGGGDAMLEHVASELRAWFGQRIGNLHPLRVYRLRQALPAQPVGWLDPVERPVRLAERLYVCGDHRDTSSLNGAMASGRRCAEAIIADQQAT